MGELTNVRYAGDPERDRVERALRIFSQCSEILFDRAPIMMHSIDREGSLIKVNQRWLHGLKYEESEVLGKMSMDFLTEESHTRFDSDALPLFLQAGTIRSLGCSLVRKDGRVVDVLIDADICPVSLGDVFAYAALRDDADDLIQWRQATTTVRVLQNLAQAQSILGSELSEPGAIDPAESGQTANPGSSVNRSALAEVLDLAPDILASIRTLIELHQEMLHGQINYQQELMLMADAVETSLADLANIAAQT